LRLFQKRKNTVGSATFKKIKKIFQKPLDKRGFYAIIKVQKETNEQKMFESFIF
jgi:hypothetical protein